MDAAMKDETRPIRQGMDSLGIQVDKLAALIEVLGSRLSPVMNTQVAPTDSLSPGAEPGMSDVLYFLKTVTERIEALQVEVSSLTRRLEV